MNAHRECVISVKFSLGSLTWEKMCFPSSYLRSHIWFSVSSSVSSNVPSTLSLPGFNLCPLMMILFFNSSGDGNILSSSNGTAGEVNIYNDQNAKLKMREMIEEVAFIYLTSPMAIGQRCGMHEFPRQFSHGFTFMQHIIARESLESRISFFFKGMSVGRTNVSSVYFVSNEYKK